MDDDYNAFIELEVVKKELIESKVENERLLTKINNLECSLKLESEKVAEWQQKANYFKELFESVSKHHKE